jgi:hypothetical protein
MHPSLEISAKLQAYLDRSIALQELRDWFRNSAGALFDSPEGSVAVELAAALQLALVQYDKGDFSERQMKTYLKQAVQDIREAETTSVFE